MGKENSRKFRNLPWFETLVSEVLELHIGASQTLTNENLSYFIEKTQVQIPKQTDLTELSRAIRGRIAYETASTLKRTRSFSGQLATQADLEIKLGDIESDLLERIDKSHWRQYRSAIAGLLPAMRSIHSQDTSSGLVSTFDPGQIRLKYLSLVELEKIQSFLARENQGGLKLDPKTARNYLSKLRTLSRELFGKDQSLLGHYHSISHEITSEIKAISRCDAQCVKRVIGMAGLCDLDSLLREQAQHQIAKLAYKGDVRPRVFRVARRGLRHLWKKHNIPVGKIFECQSREAFFPIANYPDLAELERKLKIAFKPKMKWPIEQFLRSVCAANKISNLDQLKKIRPSDFITVLYWLVVNNRSLGSLASITTIKRIILSPQFIPFFSGGVETFEEFSERVSQLKFPDTYGLMEFSAKEYVRVFFEGKIDQHLFFEKFCVLCKRVAYQSRIAKMRNRKRHAKPEFFDILTEHIANIGYGEIVKSPLKKNFVTAPDGSKRTGGLLTRKQYSKTEKRDVRLYTAFAFQVYMSIRFVAESPHLILLEKRPSDLQDPDAPTCVYWQDLDPKKPGTHGRYEMFIHQRHRKSGYSYISPSSRVLDSILKRYFEICEVRSGEQLFPRNPQDCADYIKQQLIKLFGHFVTFEQFFNEGRSECLTTHSCRHILRRLISLKYHGHDRLLAARIALGHAPKGEKDESSQKKTYDLDVHDSLAVIDTLWRIKNGDFETEDQKRARQSEERETQLLEQVAELKNNLHDAHATGKQTLEIATATKEIATATKEVIDENLSARANLAAVLEYFALEHPKALNEFMEHGRIKKIE